MDARISMTTVIVGILASLFLQGQSLSDPEKLAAWQARYPSIDFLKTCEALTRPNPPESEIGRCEKTTAEFLAKTDNPPASSLEAFAYSTLGWIAMRRNNWKSAESAFERSLALDPNNAQVDYFMGTALASEKKVDRIPAALFYFARAAVYEGPGELPAPARAQALTYVQRQYKNFHGSEEGLTELLAEARAQTAPPADLNIQRPRGVFYGDPGPDPPPLALWKMLKPALIAPEGRDYFEMGMKGAQLPTLKGKVVRLEPETNPTTILLSMEDGAPPEVTLKLDAPLEGKAAPGTELSFEGIGDSFTASPFMVVFRVDRGSLHR